MGLKNIQNNNHNNLGNVSISLLITLQPGRKYDIFIVQMGCEMNFCKDKEDCMLETGHLQPFDRLFMANSIYETGLQGIMVVVFIKANIQSKMMNTIP